MLLQDLAENEELSVGLEAVEYLLRLQHAGGGSAYRHLGIASALDVAAYSPGRPSCFSLGCHLERMLLHGEWIEEQVLAGLHAERPSLVLEGRIVARRDSGRFCKNAGEFQTKAELT